MESCASSRPGDGEQGVDELPHDAASPPRRRTASPQRERGNRAAATRPRARATTGRTSELRSPNEADAEGSSRRARSTSEQSASRLACTTSVDADRRRDAARPRTAGCRASSRSGRRSRPVVRRRRRARTGRRGRRRPTTTPAATNHRIARRRSSSGIAAPIEATTTTQMIVIRPPPPSSTCAVSPRRRVDAERRGQHRDGDESAAHVGGATVGGQARGPQARQPPTSTTSFGRRRGSPRTA